MSPQPRSDQNAKSASETMPISVLVVDDHHVVRVGLCSVISDHPQLRVVGEASTAAEATAKCEELAPDVVLLDIRMPGGSGIEACRWIKQRCPATRVLFLTSYSDQQTLVEALSAGADGYVLKTVNGTDIADAVEKVGCGETVVDPLIARQMFSMVASSPPVDKGPGSPIQLTEREQRVLAMVHGGHTNKAIGAALGLSEKTVRNLLTVLFRKFGATSRKEAAGRWAASQSKVSKKGSMEG